MAKAQNFKAGDRVAFTVQFLKATGQQVGGAGFMRGTYLKPEWGGTFARVRWDNEDSVIAASSQAGDLEWEADVRANGSLVCAANICKVGLNTKFAAC